MVAVSAHSARRYVGARLLRAGASLAQSRGLPSRVPCLAVPSCVRRPRCLCPSGAREAIRAPLRPGPLTRATHISAAMSAGDQQEDEQVIEIRTAAELFTVNDRRADINSRSTA